MGKIGEQRDAILANIEVRKHIFKIAAKVAQVDVDELNDDTPVGCHGLELDSIATHEMLLAIETETGIPMRSEALTSDDLTTLGGVVRYFLSL